jgi:hypothetical protein
MIGRVSKRLTDNEFRHLLTLLQRYAETDLDQHDAWQLETPYGPVFVRLTRELREDEPADDYRRMAPQSQQPTEQGREARGQDR